MARAWAWVGAVALVVAALIAVGGQRSVPPPVLASGEGTLAVRSSPPQRSQILVDGVPRDTRVVDGLPLAAGRYEVCFTDVAGWTTPDCRRVTVPSGAEAKLPGRFRRTGGLRVSTSPVVPSTISVDGVPREDGAVSVDLPPGRYEVCWGPVDGYVPPPCESVRVRSGDVTSATGAFEEDGSAAGPDPGSYGYLRARVWPGVGAQIHVDGHLSARQELSRVKLPPGRHEVCFDDVYGYATPACRTVKIAAGDTTSTTGIFRRNGLLHVTSSSALGGIVSLDGVARDRDETTLDLPPATYEVCWSAVVGYDTPACQTVTVTAGATTEVLGTYTETGGTDGGTTDGGSTDGGTGADVPMFGGTSNYISTFVNVTGYIARACGTIVQPANGSAFTSGSGTAYAPDPGFVGHDTFNCDGATIEVDVLLPEDG